MGTKRPFWGSSAENQPELQLCTSPNGGQWTGRDRSSHECGFESAIPGAYHRNKLGFFYERGGPHPTISQSQTTAKYNEVLSKALMDLMSRLNDHFNVDFDDSNLGDNSRSSSLSSPFQAE